MPKKRPPPPPLGSLKLRKTLSMPRLLNRVRTGFEQIEDPRKKKSHYPLTDILMSGLALFLLKDGSLLQFDQRRQDEARRHNLWSLYGINQAPCDSYLRTVLDSVDPVNLRPIFQTLHQEVQRQGILEDFRFLGKYLVSIDGTGHYNSGKVSCPECCSLTPITFILSTVSDKDPSAKLLFYSLASVLKLTVSRHVRETDSW